MVVGENTSDMMLDIGQWMMICWVSGNRWRPLSVKRDGATITINKLGCRETTSHFARRRIIQTEYFVHFSSFIFWEVSVGNVRHRISTDVSQDLDWVFLFCCCWNIYKIFLNIPKISLKDVWKNSKCLSGKCRSQVKCRCVRGLKLGFPKFARKINQDLPLTILYWKSPTKKIRNI